MRRGKGPPASPSPSVTWTHTQPGPSPPRRGVRHFGGTKRELESRPFLRFASKGSASPRESPFRTRDAEPRFRSGQRQGGPHPSDHLLPLLFWTRRVPGTLSAPAEAHDPFRRMCRSQGNSGDYKSVAHRFAGDSLESVKVRKRRGRAEDQISSTISQKNIGSSSSSS